MTIIHSNGDTTEWSSTTITYFLGQGDQAKLTYTFDGMCMSGGLPRFVVRKDGEVIHDVNAGSGIEFDVSTSGFYETDGPYIDYYFGPGTFFIVNGQVPLVELDVKAWLQGPYDPDSGSMHDNLRIAGILPSYLNIDSTTLAITGPNAVVDQVLVELRLDNAHYTPCGRVSGLLQRDGDVVASDGFSPLTIDAPAGSYYVIIGHRNHLRAMTASGHWLSGVPVTLDFRDPEFPVFGTEARKIQGDAALLWAGKVVSGFFSIRYTGSYNCRDAILQEVGSDPTHTVAGYSNADVNMDGIVKYTGLDNDRDVILLNLGSDLATGVRVEQVP